MMLWWMCAEPLNTAPCAVSSSHSFSTLLGVDSSYTGCYCPPGLSGPFCSDCTSYPVALPPPPNPIVLAHAHLTGTTGTVPSLLPRHSLLQRARNMRRFDGLPPLPLSRGLDRLRLRDTYEHEAATH
jgi:hypothetical protein